MHSPTLILAGLQCLSLAAARSLTRSANNATSLHDFKHVIAFSIDGMHSSDVAKWIAIRPNGSIAGLVSHGYQYTDAWTSAPSDSFPGTIAQYTGATPPTTSVWYDDTWDWSFYPPGSNCTGAPGANVLYDETIDYNSTELFSGGVDPANLPKRIINGTCVEVFPYDRLRVNTIFEVVTGQGYETAYTDKHPAYEILRGPSASGLTVGYFPEIAAVNTTVPDTIAYDKLHVGAWLDWIDATTPVNTTIFNGPLTTVPTLFGGNFQSMSVAQKLIGYDNDTSLSFSSTIIEAMSFVDDSIGQVITKLQQKGLYDDTLIIVASKHGQSPINHTLYEAVNPTALNNATGVPIAWATTDDIGLLWLNYSSTTQQAVTNLLGNSSMALESRVQDVIWGVNQTKSGFGNPDIDPAVPNIIVQPQLGVTYTTNPDKFAEHGGLSYDDRVVACIASNPRMKKRTFSQKVYTTQVGPTVLKALGIQHELLQGAAAESVAVLPGFE